MWDLENALKLADLAGVHHFTPNVQNLVELLLEFPRGRHAVKVQDLPQLEFQFVDGRVAFVLDLDVYGDAVADLEGLLGHLHVQLERKRFERKTPQLFDRFLHFGRQKSKRVLIFGFHCKVLLDSLVRAPGTVEDRLGYVRTVSVDTFDGRRQITGQLKGERKSVRSRREL